MSHSSEEMYDEQLAITDDLEMLGEDLAGELPAVISIMGMCQFWKTEKLSLWWNALFKKTRTCCSIAEID